MSFGLESNGVPFGVHDLRKTHRSHQDYHELLQQAGNTRTRLFGVDPHLGTFNARSRAQSYGAPGVHPKNEYTGTRALPGSEQLEHAWPKGVKGGYGFGFQGGETAGNHKRTCGGVPRNIAGDATIKDDRFVYYGHTSNHYGVNVASKNALHYNKLPP
mmetsp:Transcript_65987/g.157788  ORF Transcript_65987/g.157788 Transcript_65987/m.157788 type:complete len:158 (-) Transcript_65987:102-575(-)